MHGRQASLFTELPTGSLHTTCRMGSVQPRLCYAISYELLDDVVEDFVHFQFVVKFINLQNQWYVNNCSHRVTNVFLDSSITQVNTFRLETTGNTKTFLQSVDVDVMAVLIGKQLVLKARKTEDVEDVLTDLYPFAFVKFFKSYP